MKPILFYARLLLWLLLLLGSTIRVAQAFAVIPRRVTSTMGHSQEASSLLFAATLPSCPSLKSSGATGSIQSSSRSAMPSANNGNNNSNSNNSNKKDQQPRIELVDGALRMHYSTQSKQQDQESTLDLLRLNPDEWTSSSSIRSNLKHSEQDTSNGIFLQMQKVPQKQEQTTRMGELLACQRLLACSRVTRYWMGPHTGTSSADIPWDTQFLLVELDQASSQMEQHYALFLPLVDHGFRATIQYDAKELQIVCAAEGELHQEDDTTTTSSTATNDNDNDANNGMRALYVGVGTDPFDLLQQGFQHVAQATQTFHCLTDKKLPKSVDQFGWCTWDAFYSKVTPQGVLQGVKALTEAGVPPKTVILDDGWQQVTPEPPNKEIVESSTDQPNTEDPSASPWALALLSRVVTAFYDKYVARAPHRAWGNKVWRVLSKTVLKDQLWNYFDAETDFNRQLGGFGSNAKFPSLGNLVKELKQDYNVQSVYCWHALHGYWRGVAEELGKQAGINVTNVHPKPSQHLLRLEPQLAWDTVSLFGVGLLSNRQDLDKFYELLHTPLVEAGVDGVKVDVQSGVSAVGGGVGGGPHLAKLYTNAMEDSVSKRFQSDNGAVNCINCMCHSTENLYRYKTTSVARASDDFYPDRPHSHTVHLVNVAYNSLFIGEICLPDWDMFHSQHESAELHAAARAIGGCPVYVSDAPGKHNVELLRKLVLPDGSILRGKLPGRPTRDCLFVDVAADGTSALKIWNENPCGGVVGAFHVQGVKWNFDTHENEVVETEPLPLTALVKAYDVEPLRQHDGPFVAWKHRSQTMQFLPNGETEMEAPLNHREWDIFTIVPIEVDEDLMWAPIGLSNMLNTGGALTNAGAIERLAGLGKNRRRAQLECRGPGRFVAFANQEPARIILNEGTQLSFTHDEVTNELSFSLPNEDENSPHHIAIEWEV